MVLVDGVADAAIPADDRGLQFGDGLFETIAVIGGRPALLDAHLARIHRDAAALGLPPPDAGLLGDEIRAVAAAAEGPCAVVKTLLTAGSGGRGYARPEPCQPRRIVSLHPAPVHPPERWLGVTAELLDRRLGEPAGLAGIKHLNRIEQVLARGEWSDSEAAEALLRCPRGRIVEATMSNLFVELPSGDVLTPPLDTCGVAGVMRGTILGRLREQGTPAREAPVEVETLRGSAAAWLCNSINGVWPLTAVPGVGRWPVSPLTRTLQAWIDGDGLACTPAVRGGAA